MDLSIIILQYNTKDLLRDCLNSVFASDFGKKGYQSEVIVVDNNSSDGSVEMVKGEFPSVKLFENKVNSGFSKGNNLGLPLSTGRYVLFLNSDTVVLPNAVSVILQYLERNPRVGAASCLVELIDGGIDFNCHRGFPTPLAAFSHFSGLSKLFPRAPFFAGYYQTFKDLNSVHEVDSVEGSFMMVRRQAGESIAPQINKWFDEDYYFNAEDIDFCYRLKEKGWAVVYNPEVKIIHYKGATHGMNNRGVADLPPGFREKLFKSSTDGMKIFYRKHYQKKYPFLVTWSVFAAINFLSRLRRLKKGI